MADNGSLIKEIKREIEGIFRHMLPGVAVLIAASLAHPHWLAGYDFGNAGNLAVLAAIAIVAGNAWYVFHRFSIHQVIDYFTYCATKKSFQGYPKWLASHIRRSLSLSKELHSLTSHIHLRSAQVIFLFLCSEIAIAFTFGADRDTFFRNHAPLIWKLSLVGIGFAVIQQVFGFIIDVHAVDTCTPPADIKTNAGSAAGN
jgi:hypothetical protein